MSLSSDKRRAAGLAVLVAGSGIVAAGVATVWLLGPRSPEFRVGDHAVAGVVQLRAPNSDDFATEQLTFESDAPVLIELFNDDTVPHGLAIETASEVISAGPEIDPGDSALYTFEAGRIPVGRHRFFCARHPWMEGVLVVERGAEQGQ